MTNWLSDWDKDEGAAPPAPGLHAFYTLTGMGLHTTAVSLIYVLWATKALAPTVSAPVMLVVWAAVHIARSHSDREIIKRVKSQGPCIGKRLAVRLGEWERMLQIYCDDQEARLLFDPNPAVLMYTLKSRRIPVVAVSAGFWHEYQDSPELLRAAIAHEAGHVAARDVERFRRLRIWMGIVAALCCLELVWSLATTAQTIRQFTGVAIGVLALGTLISVSWSALVVARELEADNHAVRILGPEPVRALLNNQMRRSRGDSPFGRLWLWLVQPNLGWRTSLPAVDGNLGLRVVLQLGTAVAAFGIASDLMITLLQYNLGSDVDSKRATQSLTFSYGLYGFWFVYSFLWGRNRQFGGRTFGALLRSVRDSLLFMAPIVACYTVVSLTGRRHDLEEIILYDYTSVWAISKIAFLGRAERHRLSPGMFRALFASTGLWISAFGIYLIASFALDLPDPLDRLQPESGYTVFIPLTVGIIAHFLSPSAPGSPIDLSPDAQFAKPLLIQLAGSVIGAFWNSSGPVLYLLYFYWASLRWHLPRGPVWLCVTVWLLLALFVLKRITRVVWDWFSEQAEW